MEFEKVKVAPDDKMVYIICEPTWTLIFKFMWYGLTRGYCTIHIVDNEVRVSDRRGQ